MPGGHRDEEKIGADKLKAEQDAQLAAATHIDVKMDGKKERTVSFDSAKMRHFDHGYAVIARRSGLEAHQNEKAMFATQYPWVETQIKGMEHL